ncbi:HipA domain-containing protein [Opitutales bacterium]|nr:HipA domain-containing protein [Opitutales bacterium]
MMSICPITLQPTSSGQSYSEQGLKQVHSKVTHLVPLEYSNAEQLRQARLRSDKMSIQGVQPKLSAVLRLNQQRFELVDHGGRFILKPNPPQFQEVPANEALTMTMARIAGIDVPTHGLVPAIDGSWVYFVKRFDRAGRTKRIHVEDFAQLSQSTRETKYDSSLERVVQLVEEYCTFPAIEKLKLARRLLFCFMTGNEDMHLKNFSVWLRNGVVSLTPAYDLLNTTVVLENATEESALPLQGKKKNLSRRLWLNYLCEERLGLKTRQIERLNHELQEAVPTCRQLTERSFLSDQKKAEYLDILNARSRRLEFA